MSNLDLIGMLADRARREADDAAFREHLENVEIANEAVAGGARRTVLRAWNAAEARRTLTPAVRGLFAYVSDLEEHPGRRRAEPVVAVPPTRFEAEFDLPVGFEARLRRETGR